MIRLLSLVLAREGLGQYAYQREDGVKADPIACLDP